MQKNESWYALHVMTGQEEKVQQGLTKIFEDSFKAIVPKRVLRERRKGKWSKVKKKLFPGYVLLIGDVSLEISHQIVKLPFYMNLLRDRDGPLKINDNEVAVLKLLIDDDNAEIGMSKSYKEGEQVRILEGPLMGLEGYIKRFYSRKGRAEIVVDFLGSSRSIQVGMELIEKI